MIWLKRGLHHEPDRKDSAHRQCAFGGLRLTCGRCHRIARGEGLAVIMIRLSYGERGESAKLWRQLDMTLSRVKAERQKGSQGRGHASCHHHPVLDLGDYPITLSQDSLYRLVDVYRAIHPSFVLSHSTKDIYNHDHPAVTDFAQHARIIAQAHGHNPGQKVLGAPPVFLFEPHQPEQCDWKPDVLLDISPVWERKRAAIECMAGQEHLWEYYTRVAQQRGAQAARNSEKKITWGEGYEAVFPHVVESLA